MIPGLGIGALVLAGAAAASLVVVSTVPTLHAISQSVGIDQPISEQVVFFDGSNTPDYPLSVHVSAAAQVLQIRVTFTRDGSSDGHADAGSVSNQKSGVHELAGGSVDWVPDAPGDFTLTPAFRTKYGWYIGKPVGRTAPTIC